MEGKEGEEGDVRCECGEMAEQERDRRKKSVGVENSIYVSKLSVL
jgi:hypothetical protein